VRIFRSEKKVENMLGQDTFGFRKIKELRMQLGPSE
jgi:hypothetical protein